MAARQDQTLQIGLIISALLVFILGIVAYLNYRWLTEAEQRADGLAQQKSSADNAARESIVQSETYLAALGFDPAESFDTISTEIEADKQRYMSNFDEDSRAYRSVLESIYEENQKIARQEAEAKGRVKELQDRLAALEAEKNAQIEEYKQQFERLRQDLEGVKADFAAVRANLEQQRSELTQSRQQIEQDYEKRLAEANALRDEKIDELAVSERSRRKLLEERKVESPGFDTADGSVTYVNQGTQTVWIDLGEEDSLRRQVTFSVFASQHADAAAADKKGSIEVTRLLGPHLAEGRITNDDPTDPITPGDRVYSQVWQRGKKLRYAFTGLIDIDGDGQNDLQRAKDLIALAGGTIDASAGDDGAIDGAMTISTRYLVLGERPTQPSRAGLADSYDRMSAEAAKLGVDTISIVDFLSQIGYEPREETFVYGQRAGSGASGAASGASRSFRFRTP